MWFVPLAEKIRSKNGKRRTQFKMIQFIPGTKFYIYIYIFVIIAVSKRRSKNNHSHCFRASNHAIRHWSMESHPFFERLCDCNNHHVRYYPPSFPSLKYPWLCRISSLSPVLRWKTFWLYILLWRQKMNDALQVRSKTTKHFLWNVHYTCSLFCIRLSLVLKHCSVYDTTKSGLALNNAIRQTTRYYTRFKITAWSGFFKWYDMIWYRFILLLTHHHWNGVKYTVWYGDWIVIQLSFGISSMRDFVQKDVFRWFIWTESTFKFHISIFVISCKCMPNSPANRSFCVCVCVCAYAFSSNVF